MLYLKLIILQKSNLFYILCIMRNVPLIFSKFKLERTRNVGEFGVVIIITVVRKRSKKGL